MKSLLLSLVLLMACGDNLGPSVNNNNIIDGGLRDGGDIDAAPDDWPSSPNDYRTHALGWVDTLTIPALSGEPGSFVPTCCRDFGAISKDKLEEETNNIDNAFALFFKSLETLSVDALDFQGNFDDAIDQEHLVMLLDHRDLPVGDDNDRFILAVLRGIFADGTSPVEGSLGDGVFTIDALSFLAGTGEPTTVWSNVTFNSGSVATPPGDMEVPFAFSNDSVLYLPVRQGRISGTATVSANGVEYSTGEISGYVTVESLFTRLNDTVASSQCSCLGASSPIFVKDDGGNPGQYSAGARCVDNAEALCTEADEAICVTIADGNVGDGGLCDFWQFVSYSQADINLSGGTEAYEALSLGLQFTTKTAEMPEN
jgi:hypothetical protein